MTPVSTAIAKTKGRATRFTTDDADIKLESLSPSPRSKRATSRRRSAIRCVLWVSKSLAKLASALTGMGFSVGADTVRAELLKLGFSRQGNR